MRNKNRVPHIRDTVVNDTLSCRRGDSNPHGFPHTPLKRARLPIPPLRPTAVCTRASPLCQRNSPLLRRSFPLTREEIALVCKFVARSSEEERIVHARERRRGKRDGWRRGSVLAALLLAGCATAEIAEKRVVTGTVTDEEGKPVVGTPVLLVARGLDLRLLRFEYEETGRKEARTVTDESGRYRVEIVPADLGNNLHLFFYDREGFDRVRYTLPDSIDITARLEREAVVAIDQVLHTHPRWREVEARLREYGPDSPRGRVLRQLGLPERRQQEGTGGQELEIWWYYGRGISYRFVGGELVGTFQFEPIPAVPPR